MSSLLKRIIKSAAYRLNVISEKITLEEGVKKEKQWLSKFSQTDYFDYELSKDLKIKLFKDTVLSKRIYEGFETEEIDFVNAFLKEGDIFFDIGANIGLFSLIAAKKVGEQGKVYAFEPSPKTFARLKDNVEVNKLQNVFSFNLGLSDKKEKLKLNVSEDGFDAWNSFAKLDDINYQKVVEVDVCTLDEFIFDNQIEKIDLIKLDVEGWEKFVLNGGKAFLNAHSPIVMVEFTDSNTFSAGYHVQELYDILQGWGFEWYRYENKELVREIKKLYYPYDNLFAIKDLNSVLNKINS